MSHSDLYRRVINSTRWKRFRAQIIILRHNKCERCERDDLKLELHHKTYENLGCEKQDDVELLCEECHPVADEERKRITSRNRGEKRWEARLDSWATKVYGEDWRNQNPELIEQRFISWLERKGEKCT